MKHRLVFLLTTLLATGTASAQSLVTVQSMNYPVWVERGDSLSAVSAGAELENGDTISTGKSGRVWLEMNDGSVVKLGQNARFRIQQAAYQQDQGETVLDAALDVLKGAFRYTTSFFKPKRRSAHRVNIKVGAFTAGLRGTDIWGRSSDEEDFIALLEGSIDVTVDGQTSRMDQPKTMVRKPRGASAQVAQSVDDTTVLVLGLETELSKGEGIASEEGEYDVTLMSLTSGEYAAAMLDQFRGQGYAVRKQMVTINDQRFSRIVLPGFINREAAQNQADLISQRLQLSGVWIKKNSF